MHGMHIQNLYSTSGRLCAVSQRHGSIASCASLPDVNSLPNTDLGMTTMSRQASQAQSSSFDGQADRSQSQATADSQLPALPDTRLALKHNRAASWGPQGTPHNTRVSFQKCSCLYFGYLHVFCVGCKCLPFMVPVCLSYMLDAGLQLFWSGLHYIAEKICKQCVPLMMVYACGHVGVLHMLQCGNIGSDCVQFLQHGKIDHI